MTFDGPAVQFSSVLRRRNLLPAEAAVQRSSTPVNSSNSTHLEGIDHWLYRRNWSKTEMPAASSLEPTTWILFMDAVGLGRQISIQLNGADHRVIEVSPGKSFTRLGKDRFLMRPGSRTDYDSLITDLGKRGLTPHKIVHLWSVCQASVKTSVRDTLDLSFYSLLNLGQMLVNQEVSGVDIAVVSNSLQSVSGEPILEPTRAALLGPIRVVPKDYQGITCRSIDCDLVGQGTNYVAMQIIAEQCSPFSDPVVAYRGDERWIEATERLEIRRNDEPTRLKQRGRYLITGGLSDLGLLLAENLAREFRARLALVDRVACPQPGEWEAILQTESTPARTKRLIRKLIEIKSLGGEVQTISADVTKRDELKRAVELVHRDLGGIDGVIHAATVTEDQPLLSKTPESAARVLDPKIKGTLALDDVLSGVTLDFFALCSSTNAIVPIAGQIDSSAANSFLDAFATSRRNTPVVAIHCGPRREMVWTESLEAMEKNASAGNSVAVLPPPDSAKSQQASGISPRDVARAFLRILSLNTPPSVAIFEGDLIAMTTPPKRASQCSAGAVGSADSVEAVLAGWWQELLDLEQINLDDDFFELGGHSLIGVQLFSRIKKNYGISLGLSTLFEARTVRQLAQLIRPTSRASRKESREWSPLVPIQAKGTRPPLYMISGLGGNVIKFHNLAFHLGEDQPMYGLLPRGLDGTEPYHMRVEDVAADYVKAIRAMQPEGPYHLVGYSFGGIVAFEVAHQILAQGGQVGFLGFFDTLEWHYGEKIDTSLAPAERFRVIREYVRTIVSSEDRFNFVKRLLTEKFSNIKYRLFRSLGRPLPQEFASLEEINSYAAANYHPKVYAGKLTLFRSMKRTIQEGNDEFLGWGELSRGGVEVHHVSSTHFNILKEPAVKTVASQLLLCLEHPSVSA
jgi:thioesterase domain-containing protein/NAD(P)-dependent dehydrogenase (short-subunit alcohol dehydrogenase family)/acyl carrier protein